MNIRGMTVCVNYADLLRRSLATWKETLDALVVVTSTWDRETVALCEEYEVACFQTDIFYANGAKFNKGAALSYAVHRLRWRMGAEWLCMFDADMIIEPRWRDHVKPLSAYTDVLAGAYRYEIPLNGNTCDVGPFRMPQGWVIGFFTLFNNLDPHLPRMDEPLFDMHWPHAGNYDTIFVRRWPKENQTILPIRMYHQGEERKNWCGREDTRALECVLAQRKKAEDWERERMPNPPDLSYSDWKDLV